jgi:hypothetical protein
MCYDMRGQNSFEHTKKNAWMTKLFIKK